MEIMKRDKLGRQGCSGSQELPRRDIMKGDKLGLRIEIIKGNQLGRRRPAVAKSRQREPRAAQNGDHKGRQSLGDKKAAIGKIFPPLPLLASFRLPPLASSFFSKKAKADEEMGNMVKAFQQVESDFEHLCRQHSRIVERSDSWRIICSFFAFCSSVSSSSSSSSSCVFYLLLLLLLESEVQESVPSVC